MKIPFIGRVAIFKHEEGITLAREKAGWGVGILAGNRPKGHLSVQVFDKDGNPKQAREVMGFMARFMGNIRGRSTVIDLGSGVVTNVGVLAMANEYNWANPSAAVNTILALSNNHATGVGATAAAATDIKLQTPSSNGGQTPVAGTQSLISAANVQKYQSVATITYTGSESVTEWGLFSATPLTATTGSPFTATSATSATVTGTPYTASSSSVAGQQLKVYEAGTTASWGLVLNNTTSVINIPAWYKTADGTAGTTPGSTETFTVRPVMWDHKVFGAISVVNGDSIQFTYTVTINSGG